MINITTEWVMIIILLSIWHCTYVYWYNVFMKCNQFCKRAVKRINFQNKMNSETSAQNDQIPAE